MRLLTIDRRLLRLVPGAGLLEVLVQPDQTDDRAADGDRGACIVADDQPREKYRSADHHQRWAGEADAHDLERIAVEEVQAALSGNICRCTGYRKIVDAVLAAAAELAP